MWLLLLLWLLFDEIDHPSLPLRAREEWRRITIKRFEIWYRFVFISTQPFCRGCVRSECRDDFLNETLFDGLELLGHVPINCIRLLENILELDIFNLHGIYSIAIFYTAWSSSTKCIAIPLHRRWLKVSRERERVDCGIVMILKQFGKLERCWQFSSHSSG